MRDAVFDPETLPIGVLGRPHGLRGEMALRPHNPGSADLARLRSLIGEGADGAREEWLVERIRPTGDGWLVQLAGVASREAAAAYTNRSVRAHRRDLSAPRDGEFFVQDTLGCEVTSEAGARLGIVAASFWNGAQDVWIVREESGRERMIPIVPVFVRSFDLQARRIVVDWSDELDVEATAGDGERSSDARDADAKRQEQAEPGERDDG